MRSQVRAAVVVLVAVAATGCGSGSSSRPAEPAPAPGAATATTTGAASPSAAAWATLPGALGRCGPQPPRVQGASYEPLTLTDPAVGRIPAVRLGTGSTALVLLHQTDGNGLCGWLPFLPIAAAAGYTTLAVDLCRYGEARCRKVDDGTFTDADQVDPARLAVRYAREQLGARRVVVVGASMGGAVALMTGVAVPGLAGVVDLSGPADWPGLGTARGGRALPVPVLVAMADTEGAEAVAAARAVAAHAPAGSAFLAAPTSHGWDLVTGPEGEATPLTGPLLAWLAERTSARSTG
ncbi:alpha/beta hydrolase [Nocardioides anomalus]|uniref:Alpha/beta hydrolase n=1 Tax=Nocardioides anomalus TaxID=2712223 RepID=A0A6G6W8Z9_9ACTN|nr:alpha/beta hydrolase [Nocardioides anomalus]QIG41696.1 alpha/beta hydrolase [Nocardioides anomalus]